MTKEVYPHQIAFNVLPQVDSFLPDGYTKEEMKLQNEGRKIMHHPAFRASVTCVRVPVYRAHSVAVSAEFKQPVSVDAAREVLSKAPGLDVVDDPEKNKKFGESLGLDYPILSDPTKETAKAYGVVHQDRQVAERWTFYIDKSGKIAAIDKSVKTAEHGKDIAARLKELGVSERKG